MSVSFSKKGTHRMDRRRCQLRLLEADQVRVDLRKGDGARVGKVVDVVGNKSKRRTVFYFTRVVKSGAQVGAVRQVFGRPRMRFNSLLDEYISGIAGVTSVMS